MVKDYRHIEGFDYNHFSGPRLNEVLHDVNISYICCAAVTVSHYSPLSGREFKKLRRQLQRKRHFKIELFLRLNAFRFFQFDHVVQNRRRTLFLVWNKWFSCKKQTEKKRFTATGSHCYQNLMYDNFTLSFGRLCPKIALRSVLHVQHDYFSLFNQSSH